MGRIVKPPKCPQSEGPHPTIGGLGLPCFAKAALTPVLIVPFRERSSRTATSGEPNSGNLYLEPRTSGLVQLGWKLPPFSVRSIVIIRLRSSSIGSCAGTSRTIRELFNVTKHDDFGRFVRPLRGSITGNRHGTSPWVLIVGVEETAGAND